MVSKWHYFAAALALAFGRDFGFSTGEVTGGVAAATSVTAAGWAPEELSGDSRGAASAPAAEGVGSIDMAAYGEARGEASGESMF